jgi:hypothetical protein
VRFGALNGAGGPTGKGGTYVVDCGELVTAASHAPSQVSLSPSGCPNTKARTSVMPLGLLLVGDSAISIAVLSITFVLS